LPFQEFQILDRSNGVFAAAGDIRDQPLRTKSQESPVTWRSRLRVPGQEAPKFADDYRYRRPQGMIGWQVDANTARLLGLRRLGLAHKASHARAITKTDSPCQVSARAKWMAALRLEAVN